MQVGEPVWRLDRGPAAQEREGFGRVATGGAVFTEPCARCGRPGVDFGQPPVEVRWRRGEPKKLADFVWPSWGLGEVFVSPRVAAALDRLDGVDVAPIELGGEAENPETGRPQGKVPQSVREELSSYSEIRSNVRARVVLDASSFEFGPNGRPCSVCGRFAISWGPPGQRAPGVLQPPVAFVPGAEHLERLSMEIDALDELVCRFERRPPTEGQGVGFSRHDIGEAHLWRPLQHPTDLLCSGAFKAAVEATGASNIEFFQVGRVVDDH